MGITLRPIAAGELNRWAPCAINVSYRKNFYIGNAFIIVALAYSIALMLTFSDGTWLALMFVPLFINRVLFRWIGRINHMLFDSNKYCRHNAWLIERLLLYTRKGPDPIFHFTDENYWIRLLLEGRGRCKLG